MYLWCDVGWGGGYMCLNPAKKGYFVKNKIRLSLLHRYGYRKPYHYLVRLYMSVLKQIGISLLDSLAKWVISLRSARTLLIAGVWNLRTTDYGRHGHAVFSVRVETRIVVVVVAVVGLLSVSLARLFVCNCCYRCPLASYTAHSWLEKIPS
jgi:hypothetical protein